ncbi:hypothetical protein [Pedosphaera parvula]|uniref:hypothetical protein n=1 Tax=Pedosphaera parvula TaxID=1032527 RepID=UPI00135F14E1|nr:hypothetical protein [Pedosphaera parvula]
MVPLFLILVLVAVILSSLATAILLGFGIVSCSILIGWLRRNPATAFRALFVQLGAFFGIAGGMVIAFLLRSLTAMDGGLGLQLFVGAAVGLLCGLALAFAFNLMWTSALNWAFKRINRIG